MPPVSCSKRSFIIIPSFLPTVGQWQLGDILQLYDRFMQLLWAVYYVAHFYLLITVGVTVPITMGQKRFKRTVCYVCDLDHKALKSLLVSEGISFSKWVRERTKEHLQLTKARDVQPSH